MTTIFLSYARGDDEPFVRRIYDDLRANGFGVWFDRVSMPSRQLTFFQEIRDAIAAHDRQLLVVGPKAVTSDYVTQEWQNALEMGKCVNPIVRINGQRDDGVTVDGYALIPEELKLIHAEDFRDDSRYAEHLANLVRQLSDPAPPLGKLVAVPTLPLHYLAQRERLIQLRDALLIDLQRPIVVTGAAARVGVQGMGGIGKSVLAAALARDLEVRRAFPDGIFWIGVGQQPNLVELQRFIAKELGDEALFDDLHAGKQKLKELLAERAALLVLDDVWQSTDASAFDVLGPRCKLLLTTRDAGLVSTMSGTGYQVQLPTAAEALALLANAARVPVESLPPLAAEIVAECGRLPLALALCGGMVQAGITWRDLLDALREHELEFLANEHALEAQHRNLWRAMEVSVRVLPEDKQQRFTELAVFSPGVKVREAAAVVLWGHTGGLSERHARRLLVEFKQRSLVQLDRTTGAVEPTLPTFSLHDLLHDFAVRLAAQVFGNLAALHNQLLEAYRQQCPNGWPSGPNDHYFLQRLAHHLLRAGRGDELLALLFDFLWLSTKIDSDPHSLERDFRLLLQSDVMSLTGEERSHLLQLHEVVGPLPSTERLPTALWGHFADTSNSRLHQLLEQARTLTRKAWLRPITPSMANDRIIQAITGAGRVESLAIGDTAEGDPIIVTVGDTAGDPIGDQDMDDYEPRRRVRIWIGGVRMRDVPVPDAPFIEEINRPGDHSVTAINLPGDSRPALLHTWIDPTRGTCCRLLDLSTATLDIFGHLFASLHGAEGKLAGSDRLQPLGPTMAMGDGKPISISSIAGRLVLLSYFPATHPRLVCEDGKDLTAPDLVDVVDDEVFAEWRDLVLWRSSYSGFEGDEIGRLKRLARALTAALEKEVSVVPGQSLPARAVVWDIETGVVLPKRSWSMERSSRPLLVGETSRGRLFLLFKYGADQVAMRKGGSADPVPLSWMSFAERPVLSHRRGRPVIVKGGLGDVEVVDASTCKTVGRFSKHLDTVTLLAAGKGEAGTPLVASVGKLGSRGRFSTSIRIWDVETQAQITPTGTAHTEEIRAVTSGSYRGAPVFATGSWDLICIWPARALPGYSSDQEPNEIADPNICGRIPLSQLPPGYRHHDLGAVCPVRFGAISTWGSRRSSLESLNSTYQEWSLGSPVRDGRHGRVSSPIENEAGSDVVSVWISGEGKRTSVIETVRRNGTHRRWMFSPRADWERQSSDWRYWHCVSIAGAVVNGTRITIQVEPYSGKVTIGYKDPARWKKLTFEAGCPATQCAFGEDGHSLVVFDERGAAHHLELVISHD